MSKLIKITNVMINSMIKDPNKYAQQLTVTNLANTLKALSDAYYNDQPLVDDTVFDTMKDVLEERDPTNKFLKQIGATVKTDIEKVTLPYPMGSLSKVKPEKENLDIWVYKFKGPYVLSDKEDGISAQLHKVSENVFKLYTRGDGEIGQDISKLISYIIPNTVKLNEIPIGMSIRGEIIMSKKNFDTISATMKNARNAVAGLVNSKTVDDTYRKNAKLCDFVTYEVMNPRYKQKDQFKMLNNFGFKTAEYKLMNNLTYTMLSDYLKLRRATSDYEIDGIVVMDDSKVHELADPNTNPDYAFAFKTVLDDQVAIATVVQVHWDPSKDGYLKPTIEIKPINLVGVTITNATAFNAKFVEDNKLGPGAKVKIVRSGDVIPHIMEVVEKSKTAQMPDIPYIWTPTHVDIMLKDIFAAQADVRDAIIVKQLDYFFKKIGAKYIAEGIITKLVAAGYKSVYEIMSADKKKLSQIEGIGDKLVNKIFESIISSLESVKLNTLMAASHVFGRGMGERKIKEIIILYPNILNEKWSDKILMEKIMAVDGFSTISATKFCDNLTEFKQFLKKLRTIDKLETVLKHLDKPAQKPILSDADADADDDADVDADDINKEKIDLTNKIFVFTGFRDKQLEEKINELNGKVSTSVSKKTTIVVKAADAETSSKLVDADKLGIPIMTKEEFIKHYDLN